MKEHYHEKTLLTVLLATASAITFADGSFTGAGLEVGAGVTKSDVRNAKLNEKTKGDVAVRGSYNTQSDKATGLAALKPVSNRCTAKSRAMRNKKSMPTFPTSKATA